MDALKKLIGFFARKNSSMPMTMPLLIIKKEADNSNVKECISIEEAIAKLENDSNVPADKIKKLRLSLKNLKNKSSIKIKNGEIIK